MLWEKIASKKQLWGMEVLVLPRAQPFRRLWRGKVLSGVLILV